MRLKCRGCQFFGDDPTKILIKVPGISGYELSEMLYQDFDVEDERTNENLQCYYAV